MTIPTDDTPLDAGNAGGDLPEALRWQLRALRRDEPPSRELWPGIAARLQTPAPATGPWRPRWMAPFAVAATLVVGLGAALVLWRDGFPPATPSAANAPSDTLVQREAFGLARQYDAALAEVAFTHPALMPALQATVDDLDRSLVLIQDALARDPDSQLLLDQLRRTYAHRLALAQRAT